MINLRLPKMDAPNTNGQLKQLHSYLYQTIGELQVILEGMDRELAECKTANQELKAELQRVQKG